MSYSYSDSSLEELNTCDPRLISLFKEAINFWNIIIINGRRGKEKQNKKYQKGLTKKKYPESKHNKKPSMAVDAAPYFANRKQPIPWKKPDILLHFAGKIIGLAKSRGIEIRYGGDWDGDFVPVTEDDDETFFDGIHFELLET